jgi:hypothetical protein
MLSFDPPQHGNGDGAGGDSSYEGEFSDNLQSLAMIPIPRAVARMLELQRFQHQTIQPMSAHFHDILAEGSGGGYEQRSNMLGDTQAGGADSSSSDLLFGSRAQTGSGVGGASAGDARAHYCDAGRPSSRPVQSEARCWDRKIGGAE